MITLSAPANPQAGSRYCVSATGYVGTLTARATLDGIELPVHVTIRNGTAEICIKVPAGTGGEELILRVSDQKSRDQVLSRLVRK